MTRAILWAPIAMLATACAPAVRIPDPSPPVISVELALTEADAGRNIEVTLNQQFSIELVGNRTTGFRWLLVGDEAGAVVPLGDSAYVLAPVARGRVGAGGVETWRFKARRAGRQALLFEYRRPWELETAPARSATFQISVRPSTPKAQ